MKKLILLMAFSASSFIFSQGKIHIFNYTPYSLSNSLIGSNATANCFPNVSGTNHPIQLPPGGSVTYDGYRNSGSPYVFPPIETWGINSANGNSMILPHTSPVLDIYGANTTWQLNKFALDDPSGPILLYSGATIGTIGCNTTPITTVGGPGTPNPFQAFWFTSGGATYFIIQ